MGNKTIPDEVTTAMDLAEAAGWKVSNRNKKVVITPPGCPNVTIGHNPNDESMKVFRANARTYNLLGQGPARTPDQAKEIHEAAEAQGLAEAERLNAQRKKYEGEQKAREQEIEAARLKAAAATQRGMTKPEEKRTAMPATKTAKKPVSNEIDPFDPALLGTKNNARFLLGDGTYYCIECWQHGRRETFLAPQGLAAHRGVKHGMYPGNFPVTPPDTQETNRVQLPADVDTAMDMLRVAVAEALGVGDPKELAAKEAELAELRTKLAEAQAKLDKADKNSADFDRRFLEAQASSDKRLAELQEQMKEKSESETAVLTQQFFELLTAIQKTVEGFTPAQAIGKVDEIIRSYLS